MDILDVMLKPILETLDRFGTLGISIDAPQGLVTIRTKLVMGVFTGADPGFIRGGFLLIECAEIFKATPTLLVDHAHFSHVRSLVMRFKTSNRLNIH